MELLESITWPKPLADLLDTCFTEYRSHHPWVAETPSPKSIVREMLEGGDSFATFVRRYRLERSEGLVLRYLTDAWRTLDRSLPDDVYTPTLEDVVEWLGALIRATDATLLDEWALLAGGPLHDHLAIDAPLAHPGGSTGGMAHRRAHRRVRMGRAARRRARTPRWPNAAAGVCSDIADAMAPYWSEYDHIAIDADARSARQFALVEEPNRWTVTQRLADPDDDGEWRFVAFVDLDTAMSEGAPTLVLEQLGTY